MAGLGDWYEGARCHVKWNEAVSGSFEIGRGVKQGSILSPVLFLLIMDPLLLSMLETSKVGLSVNGCYAGGFAHAMTSGLYLRAVTHSNTAAMVALG